MSYPSVMTMYIFHICTKKILIFLYAGAPACLPAARALSMISRTVIASPARPLFLSRTVAVPPATRTIAVPLATRTVAVPLAIRTVAMVPATRTVAALIATRTVAVPPATRTMAMPPLAARTITVPPALQQHLCRTVPLYWFRASCTHCR